ncbi:unnamed protein product [Brassica napus]|uniref:(rape) hypothetical protein n=1 Tax=Brassica napus TaxID=3708 RepID=A0A816X629_BRANA|nr:unnamed protein product [Brassica napus]
MSTPSSVVNDYLGSEDPTQETRDLISSLPSEKGWLVSHLYQFQGRWHTQALLQGLLECQKHFEAKDSDIILVTNPKSRTTWLKALVFSLLNRHKFPVSSGTLRTCLCPYGILGRNLLLKKPLIVLLKKRLKRFVKEKKKREEL